VLRGIGRPAVVAALLLAAVAAEPARGVEPVIELEPVQAVVVLEAVPDAGVLASLSATGATVVGFDHLPMAAVQALPTVVDAIGALPGVESVWPNRPVHQVLAESVPLIGADTVRDDLGFTGEGVAVAVLDSGIDGFHPDVHYPEHTVQNVKLLGYQKVFADLVLVQEDVQNTDTTTGHGTHVAGIVGGTGAASGALYRGVAPGADLVGLGAADGTDMLTALAGYDWLLGHHEEYGIRVLNNSWADGTIAYDEGDPLNVASRMAHDAGITVVFAAGNDGQGAGNVYNRYAWPEWVIGVGGGTKTGAVGDYSSEGDADHHPAVIAPGSFIASARAITGVVTDANSSPFDFTDPLNPRVIAPEHTASYTYAIGTSMASPHVAGVVALMLEAAPGLTPDEVKQLLVSTGDPVAGCAVAVCGAGYVDARAAVEAALDLHNQPPVASAIVPNKARTGRTISFDARPSIDPEGHPLSYRFEFGDGASVTTTSPTATHVYPLQKSRRVTWRVTVTDLAGATDDVTGRIRIVRWA
jgi:serine protease AprX